MCHKCKVRPGVIKYGPKKGYMDNDNKNKVIERIWCIECYKKNRHKPIICKMEHDIKPWPFVDVTDECNRSKLPNWQRPRKNNDQYDMDIVYEM